MFVADEKVRESRVPFYVMEKPKYLFVNKTPCSPGSATKESEDRKLINRHAQLHGLALRGLTEQNQELSSSFSVIRNVYPRSSPRRKPRHIKPSGAKRQGPDASIPETEIGDIQESLSLFFLGMQNPEAKVDAYTLLERVLSTMRAISAGKIKHNHHSNPLQGPLLSLDTQICRYLQRHSLLIHEKTLIGGRHVDLQGEQTLLDTAISMFKRNLSNDLLLYSLLANMSSIASQQNSHMSRYQSKYYCVRATTALREELSLSNAPDTTIILSLWHLISAEMNHGNFEAATIHLKGAAAICDLLHIDDPDYIVPFQVYDSLLATGIFKQYYDVSAVLFDTGSSYRHFHNLSLVQGARDPSMGNDLLSSEHGSLVSPDLRRMIEELIEYNESAAAGNYSQEDWKNSMNDGHWSRLSWKLLSSQQPNHLVGVLARAVSLWIYLMLYTLSDIKMALPVSYSIRRLLSATSQQDWEGHKEVLIWILSVGAAVPLGDRAEQTWYARKLVSLLDDSACGKTYDFANKNDIVVFSKRYFWIDEIQKGMLEPLVMLIKSIRLEKSALKPSREPRFFSSYTGEASGKGKWHKLSDWQNSKQS